MLFWYILGQFGQIFLYTSNLYLNRDLVRNLWFVNHVGILWVSDPYYEVISLNVHACPLGVSGWSKNSKYIYAIMVTKCSPTGSLRPMEPIKLSSPMLNNGTHGVSEMSLHNWDLQPIEF